ncbi:MAG: hypothetical protein J6Q60_05665 [Bacteroidaceae bacterium]|nr:hypothetical protein [Bacteroidaceae bacterium]
MRKRHSYFDHENSKIFFVVKKRKGFWERGLNEFWASFFNFVQALNHRLIFDFLWSKKEMVKLGVLGQKTVAAQHFFGFLV